MHGYGADALMTLGAHQVGAVAAYDETCSYVLAAADTWGAAEK